MDKIFKSEALIRFSDCDPLGHLNNTRYLDYFLNAREDQLKAYVNFDVYEHSQKTGRIWVMFQNNITYLKPVFFNNYVTITCQVIGVFEKSLKVEMQMLDKKTGELKAVLWMTAVYMDMMLSKGVAHEDSVKNMLDELYEPLDQLTFDDRVKFLQGK